MVQKDRIRENIVDVAKEIFRKYGYKKTTMDDIAMAANKGKSSIYYYFKSKEEVYRAVVEREAEQFDGILLKAIENAKTPAEKIGSYILARMKEIGKFDTLLDALKNEGLGHLAFISKFRTLHDATQTQRFAALLREGVEQGRFQIYDPALAAVAIITAMKGMEAPIFLNQDDEYKESSIHDLVNIVLYGIVKR